MRKIVYICLVAIACAVMSSGCSDNKTAKDTGYSEPVRRQVAKTPFERYSNGEHRNTAEGYFFKAIKYYKGDGVSPHAGKARLSIETAIDMASPNQLREWKKWMENNEFGSLGQFDKSVILGRLR